jgi:hypothetical protein
MSKTKTALKIQPWHDYHGDALFFRILDADGNECGRYASELEAEWKPAEMEREARRPRLPGARDSGDDGGSVRIALSSSSVIPAH